MIEDKLDEVTVRWRCPFCGEPLSCIFYWWDKEEWEYIKLSLALDCPDCVDSIEYYSN